jgi:antitoxin (DNA-binding transcriptional repressor) of toxin-antitoxin stability system
MNAPFRHAISMRELQKMSAKQIRALPHTVPITSDGQTIALLQPLREPKKADDASRKAMEDAFRRFDESLTPEQKRKAAKMLAEIEGE